MFPTSQPVQPLGAKRSVLTLREIDKDSPSNAHLMERFEASRTNVSRVTSSVAHPGLLVTCTASGFIQVVDMSAGTFKLFLVYLDSGDANYIDLAPRCIAIDPAPSLVSQVGAASAGGGSNELALVFAPSYTATIVHASTFTGVVHELIALRSRPSSISIDGDFAVAGDSSCEACAWRSGSYSLLWRKSLTPDNTSSSISNILQHRETCFFALTNASIIVCAVRTGVVLTTLLGDSGPVAGIAPTPPFADAVVVATTRGTLTVWAPPLRTVGQHNAPTATSLAANPEQIEGQSWQILNVISTDMQIKSLSLQNGFLSLGGVDGRVALFDATQISLGRSQNPLPQLFCYDLDHPILHCGVGNDNCFSIATTIGDVWRWPLQDVLPPPGERDHELQQQEEQQQQALLEQEEGEEQHQHHHRWSQEDEENDVANQRDFDGEEAVVGEQQQHHHHHQQQQQHQHQHEQDEQEEEDEDDEDDDLQELLRRHEQEKQEHERQMLQQQQHQHQKPPLATPASSSSSSSQNNKLPPVERKLSSQPTPSSSSSGGGGGGTAVGGADSDLDILDTSRPQSENSEFASIERRMEEASSKPGSGSGGGEWYQQQNGGGSKQQQPTVIMVDDEDEEETGIREKTNTATIMKEDPLNMSETARPRVGMIPQPLPQQQQQQQRGGGEVSLSPTRTEDEEFDPSSQHHHQQQQQQQQQQQKRHYSAGTGVIGKRSQQQQQQQQQQSLVDSSLPSSVNPASVILDQSSTAPSAISGAGNNNNNNNNSRISDPRQQRLPPTPTPLHQQRQQQQQQASRTPTTGSSGGSGGSSGGRTGTTTTSSSSQRGSQLGSGTTRSSSGTRRTGTSRSSSSSSSNRYADEEEVEEYEEGGDNEEEEEEEEQASPESLPSPARRPERQQTENNTAGGGGGVIYHHHNNQQQQQQKKTAGIQSTVGGLEHLSGGKRMNPKAADAILKRAVHIQQDEHGVSSQHPLSKSTPQISKLLEQAADPENQKVIMEKGQLKKGGNKNNNTNGDKDEFHLQEFADENRVYVEHLMHKHAIQPVKYEKDDVAFYAIELRKDQQQQQEDEEEQEENEDEDEQLLLGGNNVSSATASKRKQQQQQQQQLGVINDSEAHHNKNSHGSRKSSPTSSSGAAATADGGGRLQTININSLGNNYNNNQQQQQDDLMPATSKKPLVRRVDPVYERQKKLAGPQFHDHLCQELLNPSLPSTVFFSDRVPLQKEPKSLVLPLPLPSSPLAF